MVEAVESVVSEEWVMSQGIAVRSDGEGVKGGGEGGKMVHLVQHREVGTLQAQRLRETTDTHNRWSLKYRGTSN